jgi:hypothetical protein
MMIRWQPKGCRNVLRRELREEELAKRQKK